MQVWGRCIAHLFARRLFYCSGKSWFVSLYKKYLIGWLVGFMVFNATFNNISVISWRSVLRRAMYCLLFCIHLSCVIVSIACLKWGRPISLVHSRIKPKTIKLVFDARLPTQWVIAMITLLGVEITCQIGATCLTAHVHLQMILQNISTVKPAHAATSIKQSPVLKGTLFLSCHITFHMNWTSFNRSPVL